MNCFQGIRHGYREQSREKAHILCSRRYRASDDTSSVQGIVTGSGYVGIVFGPQHGPRLGYVGICLPLWRVTLLYLVGQIPKSSRARLGLHHRQVGRTGAPPGKCRECWKATSKLPHWLLGQFRNHRPDRRRSDLNGGRMFFSAVRSHVYSLNRRVTTHSLDTFASGTGLRALKVPSCQDQYFPQFIASSSFKLRGLHCPCNAIPTRADR